MLDPSQAETFLEENYVKKHGMKDTWTPVSRVDTFLNKAEDAVGEANNEVNRAVGGWVHRLLCCFGKEVVTAESRKITLNNESANRGFRTNFVSTAKYSILNALPKFMYEQFVLRVANTYFLFVGILYCFDQISPVLTFSRYGQLIAVAFIISVSAIKEIVEDSRRHLEDRRINNLRSMVLGPKGSVTWGKVKVGDIVKICKNEPFPADLILLYAESEDGLAFVETKQLDGESNLKVKATIPAVADAFNTEENALSLQGYVESEPPNAKLVEYYGSITLMGKAGEDGNPATKTWGVNIDNLLVRGCRLRQTPYVYGLVVNTGLDTKLLQNIKPKGKKVSTTESKVNFLLIFPVMLQVIIITTLTSLNAVNCQNTLSDWYLLPTDACTSLNLFLRFFTYFCTFANLIPISLYVSIEVIRGFQVYFIAGDNAMVDYERDPPMRMEVRTSNLTDELGILTHLFSDKTGTLTANKMDFKKCFVADQIFEEVEAGGHAEEYQRMNPDSESTNIEVMRRELREAKEELPYLEPDRSPRDRALFEARELNYLLSICHTVVPDGDVYQASSPDEGALVDTAKLNGFEFTRRTNKSVFLNVLGDDEEWELLGMIEFNSKRKRMSTIVRSPHDGRIRVYCKGADNVIFQRVSPEDGHKVTKVKQALDKFAIDGLRTLCLAYKEVSNDFYSDWNERWTRAVVAEDREERCAELGEEIETGLRLLGCTAIEDKLQEGVPETLQALEKANVKVWVLTGDKQETAINIGLSCGLLDDGMDVVVINEPNAEEVEPQLDKAFGRWSYMLKDGKDSRDFGVVIDGGTLEHVLEDPKAQKKLVLLGRIAKCVIACRASPKQKSDLVEMVQRNEPKCVTCAVGDGANDVAMIQAAHVGVGVVGVEGLEAKLASDFSIGQFRFLQRLILVHGRWCYKRLCKVICYIVYKNILLVTNDFYFAFANSFSGQPLFDPWITASYNVLLTSMPIVAIGVYDTDVAAKYALWFPEIYRRTQARTALRITVFIKWVLSGLWQGSVIFWFTRLVLGELTVGVDGKTDGLYTYGVVIFTQVVAVAHVVLMAYQSSWSGLTAFVTLLSLTFWFWLGPLMSSQLVAYDLGMTRTLLGVVPAAFRSVTLWLVLFFNVTLCVIPGHCAKYIERNYRPTTKTLVQELMRRGYTREMVLGNVTEPEQNREMPTFSRRDVEMPVTTYAFDSLKAIANSGNITETFKWIGDL